MNLACDWLVDDMSNSNESDDVVDAVSKSESDADLFECEPSVSDFSLEYMESASI